MNTTQLNQLLENYKDGIPVKVERQTIIWLCAAVLITVALSAGIVKYIRKL